MTDAFPCMMCEGPALDASSGGETEWHWIDGALVAYSFWVYCAAALDARREERVFRPAIARVVIGCFQVLSQSETISSHPSSRPMEKKGRHRRTQAHR